MNRNKRDNRSQPQITVPIPLWLQKKMRANLKNAAKNKVGPERVRIAKALLKSTKAKPEIAASRVAVKNDKARLSVDIVQPVQQLTSITGSKPSQCAKAGLNEVTRWISRSVRGGWFLRPAHSRV